MAFGLIKNTTCYNIFISDKKSETTSNATLLVCDDSAMLKNYLKIFAKTFMCKEDEPCFNCRTCRLIESQSYQDVVFYPLGKKLVVSDVDDLISKSYVKPLESDKKLFVLNDVQDMNAQAQNKLLKTLEEPPKNTYLLLGATTTYPLLKTLLSRVKRLDIPPFSDSVLYDGLKEKFPDSERLKTAIKLSGGRVGEVESRYYSTSDESVENLVYEVLLNMKTSKEVLKYSKLINKENVVDFIIIASKTIGEAMDLKSNDTNKNSHSENIKKIAEEFSFGALIFVLEKLREAEKALAFNGNITAVSDSILFGIVEGKHKWLK